LNEKEQLLLELFPSVATKFLRNKRIAEWQAAHPEGTPSEAQPKLGEHPLSPYFDPNYEPSDGEPPSFWEIAPNWAGWTDSIAIGQ
jgi:hypothetical protein